MLCQQKTITLNKSTIKKQLVSRWQTVDGKLVRKWIMEEIK